MKKQREILIAAIEALHGKEATKDDLMKSTGIEERKVRELLNQLAKAGQCVLGVRLRNTRNRLVVNPTEEATDYVVPEPKTRITIPFEVVPNIDKLVGAGFRYARISRAFKDAGFDIKAGTIAHASQRLGAYKNVPRSTA